MRVPRAARSPVLPAASPELSYHPLPNADDVPHLSVEERLARGRAARELIPLASHGTWKPPARRGDAVAMLERQSAKRIPDLLPIRYGRMVSSPFAFFRGSAAVMASDLAGTPTSGLRAQLCGDAHLMNFGLFRTPERALLFGLNDFDETLPGPWEWDLKRLAASFEVAGRDLTLTAPQRRRIVLTTARSYRESMAEFAGQTNLEVWYARLDAQKLLEDLEASRDEQRKNVARVVRKALRKDNLGAFDRLIEQRDGSMRFCVDPPLLMPVAVLLDEAERRRYLTSMRDFLSQYRSSLAPDRRVLISSYRMVDVARKVVGVGSVGTRCWVVLMLGRDSSDPLFLQLKQANRSVLEPFAGPSRYRQRGRRVVEGQRLMQAASDPLLGWYRVRGFDGRTHDLYVRQLWDGKASVDLTTLNPEGLDRYARICGWTLARGHARSGDRVAISAYLGDTDEFDEAVADFAATYADVSEEDHGALGKAVANGRINAVKDI